MKTAGNKDRVVADLIDGAKRLRQDLDRVYKELLSLGRKAKYLEPVGPAVAEAINEIQEAEMAVKRVVDAGNVWATGREQFASQARVRSAVYWRDEETDKEGDSHVRR